MNSDSYSSNQAEPHIKLARILGENSADSFSINFYKDANTEALLSISQSLISIATTLDTIEKSLVFVIDQVQHKF